MREKIIALIESQLNLPGGSISGNERIEDIDGWDSLAHVLIIGELESQLGVVIPLDEAIEIETVEDLFKKAGV
jgi:acyl carrier protein